MRASHILWFGRLSMFLIFFWFGALKVFGVSPAEELVMHLYDKTLIDLLAMPQFSIFFGLFECAIGIMWLIPSATKIAFGVFLGHMMTTFLPLVFLPEDAWIDLFCPTLIGQYIIKNLALIGLSFFVYGFSSDRFQAKIQ
jgi:uncharacterized membrane protein YkgB